MKTEKKYSWYIDYPKLFFMIIIASIAVLFFIGIFSYSKDRDKLREEKIYNITVTYLNGDTDKITGSVTGYRNEHVKFEIDRDFGSECLYVYNCDVGWQKLVCGVRKVEF